MSSDGENHKQELKRGRACAPAWTVAGWRYAGCVWASVPAVRYYSQIKNNVMELAEIEISYKAKVKPSERKQIKSSRDIYEVANEIFNADRIEYTEEFLAVYLNKANKVLGWVKVGAGGFSGTVADSRVVFGVALKCAASSIIVMHNHPSGNLKPSQADIDMTRKMKEGGSLLDVALLDHLIVSSEGYYSFADEGKQNAPKKVIMRLLLVLNGMKSGCAILSARHWEMMRADYLRSIRK